MKLSNLLSLVAATRARRTNDDLLEDAPTTVTTYSDGSDMMGYYAQFGPEDEKTTMEPETVATATTEAPTRPPQMTRAPATLPPNFKPMFSSNPRFRAFARQNNFPPLREEEKMMQEVRLGGFNPRLKIASAHDDQYLRNVQIQQRQSVGSLKCMVCNGRSYQDCYARAIPRVCSPQEGACQLEVRFYQGEVMSVQSGCSQEVACINNMKQNFFDFATQNGPHPNAPHNTYKHDCKLFTGDRSGNSVCRNCCFDNYCTDNWQPRTFDEWSIPTSREVQNQMMKFEQFSKPQGYFTQLKMMQNPRHHGVRTQIISDPADLNRPPSMKEFNSIPLPPLGERKEERDKLSLVKRKKSKKSKPASAVASRQVLPSRIVTTKPPTTTVKTTEPPKTSGPTKKGPWSHLPPWKQRQLQAARKRAMEKAREKQMQAKPQALKFSQWQKAPVDNKKKVNEKKVVQVQMSDEEFGNLISSLDKENKNGDAIDRLLKKHGNKKN